jgi:hypothetical protein
MAQRQLSGLLLSATLIATLLVVAAEIQGAGTGTLLTGKAAMGDWKSDAPGVRRRDDRRGFAPAEFKCSGTQSAACNATAGGRSASSPIRI